jgi:hypothetical protein
LPKVKVVEDGLDGDGGVDGLHVGSECGQRVDEVREVGGACGVSGRLVDTKGLE